MSIDLSAIDLHFVFWLVGLIVAVILVIALVRFFFRHLLHLVFRGCGLVLLVIIVLIVLRSLKVL